MSCFVVLQIRSVAKVLKKWYGTSIPCKSNFIDIYSQFASGCLDKGFKIPEEYNTVTRNVKVGRAASGLFIGFKHKHVSRMLSKHSDRT